MKNHLKHEIEALGQKEPAVSILIDAAGAFFWITNEGKYIWLHNGWGEGIEAYIDEDHQPVDVSAEGVAPTGVIWNNADLSTPFDLDYFQTRIETITA